MIYIGIIMCNTIRVVVTETGGDSEWIESEEKQRKWKGTTNLHTYTAHTRTLEDHSIPQKIKVMSHPVSTDVSAIFE